MPTGGALVGVADAERRKQIDAEYEAKKDARIGAYLTNLAATETAAAAVADDLDRFAQRVGVSVTRPPCSQNGSEQPPRNSCPCTGRSGSPDPRGAPGSPATGAAVG